MLRKALATLAALTILPPSASHGYVGGNWDLYRLGDVVKHHGVPKKWQPPSQSIAAEYLRRTNLENDFGVLAKIVNERRTTVAPPPPGTVVVHLRLGDTADLYEASVLWDKGSPVKRMTHNASGVLLEDYDEQFVKPQSYYAAVIDDLPEWVNHVVVVGFALHHHHLTRYDRGHRTSRAYRELVVGLFRRHQRGFTVTTRYEHNPDSDFLFMCQSQIFVQAGGGFSRIIGEVVHARGGTRVYERLDGFLSNGTAGTRSARPIWDPPS